jgi:RNA polymerase sigma-70 factor (ECF subfamily)
MNAESPASLVLRAQSGDRGAFDALLRTIDADLLRYVRRLVGNDADAEDVVQDALIQIVRKLSWLRDPALFRAWCYRIASRAAMRSLRREIPSEELTDGGSQEIQVDPWQRDRLLSALPRISPASRAVIILHYFEEMAISDVAAVLELSPGTVKSRLAYGLAQLRKEMT